MTFSTLDIKKHVLRNLSGTEENVKVKIILPLLSRLGWDTTRDCYFEEYKADILVELDGKPAFIVETKGWDQGFHYGQGLEYAVKLGTPWVVFTSGQVTELHHALILKEDLAKPNPVLETSFRELLKNPDGTNQYLSRESFQNGSAALIDRCRPLLPARLRTGNWSESVRAFEELRTQIGFKREPTVSKISTVEFEEALSRLPVHLQGAYGDLARAIHNLADGSDHLRSSRSGKALNLEAIDAKRKMVGRLKWLGLFSVFPAKQTISKSYENWAAFGLPPGLLATLKQMKPPQDAKAAATMIATLSECVRAIQPSR